MIIKFIKLKKTNLVSRIYKKIVHYKAQKFQKDIILNYKLNFQIMNPIHLFKMILIKKNKFNLMKNQNVINMLIKIKYKNI